MKKNAINQFLLFVTLIFSLVLTSCFNSINFSDSDYVTITGGIFTEALNNRSAFPGVPEGASFEYDVTVDFDGKRFTTEKQVFTSFSGLRYCVKVTNGTNRKITINIYASSKIILTGTSDLFDVDSENPDPEINITVKPLPQDEGQTGNIYLYFKNKSGKTLYVTNSYDFTVLGPLNVNNGAFFNKTVSTGSHTVKFDFHENSADGPLLFSCEQVINVYSGLTTNEWVKNGNESYIQEEDENAIVITDELINSFTQTVFYVGTTATGVTANGSYFAPYNSLEAAINQIKMLPENESITYKVYLKSDISVKGALNELRNHKIEIASVGNEKKEMEDFIGIASEDGYNDGNITFKNLKISGYDEFTIESLKSVAFEDCIVAPKVDFIHWATPEFHLKGKCSFIGGIDFTDIVAKITLDSVVKPAESGFVAKVLVGSSFDDDLSSLFNSTTDEKLLKSLAYFCIKKNATENIFIKTESTIELVPLTKIKFVADSNPETNGLGVASNALETGDGSMAHPYCSVSDAIYALLNTNQAKYIYIAGSVTQSFSNTEINLGSTSTWYFMGWNGVELNESTQNIDTITNSYLNTNSLFQITGTNANLYFLNLKIEGANTNQGTTTDNKQVGSAIYLKDKLTESEKNKVTLKNVWITNCKTKDYGGAIYVGQNNELTTENCYFGNLSDADTNRIESTTVSGGAIYSKGNLNLNNTSFRGFSSNEGGAIYNANFTVDTQSINNCYFSNNSSNFSGGAIYSLGPLGITNTTIKNCSTSRLGGAIYSQGSLVITNSTIESCKAANGGGGLYLYDINASITLDNDSKIKNCIAVDGSGIYMDENTGNIIMKNNSRISSSSQKNDIFINGNGSTQTIQLDNDFAISDNGTNSKMKIGFRSRATGTSLIEKYDTTISNTTFIQFLSYFELDTTTGNYYELITTNDPVNYLGYVYLKANP